MYTFTSYIIFDNLIKGDLFTPCNHKQEVILMKTDEDLCKDVKTGEIYHVPNGDSWLVQEVFKG